jgi:isochorismate hydrolase
MIRSPHPTQTHHRQPLKQSWNARTSTYAESRRKVAFFKTAVDAFELDLTPWLVEDASASHASKAVHEAGVLVTQRFIGEGQIITTADIPAALLGVPE